MPRPISMPIPSCSSVSDKVAESITPILLDGRPNTYTYTKACAEYVVATYGMYGNERASVLIAGFVAMG